jgi:polyisoprenoid-binding protein YceI
MAALSLAGSVFGAEAWTIDQAHSSARFKIRHLMVSNVGGEIGGLAGTFHFDGSDLTKLKADATMDPSTVDTRNAKRDEHLKSGDFFDVKKFPTIKFVSKKVNKGSGDKFSIVGDLTMHGVTKEVTLDVDSLTPAVKSPMGDMRRGLSATTKLNRKDFGLTWNKSLDGGGVVVGDDVNVNVELELVGPAKKA